jgi:hypothetical protein
MPLEVKDRVQEWGQGLMTLPRNVTPDEGDTKHEGYYFLKTDEFNCTCRKRPWRWLHFDNKVIVWPTNDDDSLLKNAQRFKELGLNPKITEYKVIMGKAIAWEDIPDGSVIG